MNPSKRIPDIYQAIIFFTIVLFIIIGSIQLGISAQMSLFLGTIASVIIALYLKNDWSDIQNAMLNTLRDSSIAILIIMLVGIMVGIWIVGGTVPSLIYYGLKLCSPKIILPLTFILCSLTSIFTGTSYGSMATMGLAMAGIASSLNIPLKLTVGAVVSGAYLGDKMSPMSDNPNMASAMTGVPLYKHIASMMYTAVPSAILCLILYTILGFKYSGTIDTHNINLICSTLQKSFNISPWALIPMILVLIVSFKKVPALLGLGGCCLVSIIFAIVLQNLSLKTIMDIAYNGYLSNTGISLVDTILSRGGIVMVSNTIILVIISCLMGATLEYCGIFKVLVEDGLLKFIKSTFGLVTSTLLYSYIILMLSGNQVLGLILGGRTLKQGYKDMNIHPKVLSRSLEDSCTIAAPLVPWSTACAYIMSIFKIDFSYIPYTFFGYTVPIFALIFAFTGFGIWDDEENPIWNKNKKAINLN